MRAVRTAHTTFATAVLSGDPGGVYRSESFTGELERYFIKKAQMRKE
jgi:hypothetical protein